MLDDLQGRVNEFALLVGLPVSLTTPDLKSIVFSPHTGLIIDAVRSQSLLSRDTEEWVVRWFRKAGVGSTTGPVFVAGIPEKQAMSRWVVPVHAGSRIMAFLSILDPEGQCSETALAGLSEQVANIGRIMLASEESARVAGGRLRRALTADDNDRSTAVAELFGQLGRPAASWMIAVGTSIKDENGRPSASWSQVPSPPASFRIGGAVAVECRFENHHAFLLESRHHLDPDGLAALAPCCPHPLIGVGGPVQDPLLLGRSYRQALGALRAASVRKPALQAVAWTELGPIKVLSLQDPDVLEDAVHDKIAALSPAETELLETVDHYLDHGRKPDLVANSLHIHRGTLYYRLRKFEDATGLDLETGRDRLTIQLSLEALKLLRAPTWQHGA
jgi:hypothetical protein